jgi:hypothetical protein
MAQLVGLIVSEDETFRKQIGRLLRSGAVPVSVVEDRALRDGVPPDVLIVDIRGDGDRRAPACGRARRGDLRRRADR